MMDSEAQVTHYEPVEATTTKPVKITVGRLDSVLASTYSAEKYIGKVFESCEEMLAGKDSSESKYVIDLRNYRTALAGATASLDAFRKGIEDLIDDVREAL